jgi:hypothetical protein
MQLHPQSWQTTLRRLGLKLKKKHNRDRFRRRTLQIQAVEPRVMLAADSLSVTVDATTLDETAGTGAATLTVTRSGDTTNPLVVDLSTSDPSEKKIKIPNQTTIPAGLATKDVSIDVIDGSVFDGDRTVTFHADATGYDSGRNTLTVEDDEEQGVDKEMPTLKRDDYSADVIETKHTTQTDVTLTDDLVEPEYEYVIYNHSLTRSGGAPPTENSTIYTAVTPEDAMFTWMPSDKGEITSIDFHVEVDVIEVKKNGTPDPNAAIGLDFNVIQNDIAYRYQDGSPLVSGGFIEFDANLTANDFGRADGQPGKPDFSSDGDEVTFGFGSNNGTQVSTLEATAHFRDFEVNVNHVVGEVVNNNAT